MSYGANMREDVMNEEEREKEAIKQAYELCEQAHSAWIKGNTLDALRYYEEALEIFKELGKLAEIANILEKIGDIYHLRGKTSEALRAYKACLDICENFEDELSTCIIAEKIAYVYRGLGEHNKMLPYLFRILEIAEKYRDPHRAGRALAGIGEVYIREGKLDSAKEALELALKIFRGMGAIEQTKILEEALKSLESRE